MTAKISNADVMRSTKITPSTMITSICTDIQKQYPELFDALKHWTYSPSNPNTPQTLSQLRDAISASIDSIASFQSLTNSHITKTSTTTPPNTTNTDEITNVMQFK